MKIAYIGIKEIKGDNIAGTGLVWTRGQVHEVLDEKKCALLTKHPLIWADVTGKSAEEIEAMLVKAPAAVEPEPRVNIIPSGDGTSPYWEPVVIPVPPEVFKGVQEKTLVTLFMTEADADAFAIWKKGQEDTSPKQTGPKARPKETKAGLDTKAGLEAGGKKAA